jgi:hypothetical protein
MSLNLLSNSNPEDPLFKEVSFEYKTEKYKVHVNLLVEDELNVYKLYFKNNIENSEKSLMKIFRKPNEDGGYTWTCKADYFSYMNEEIAVAAGQAIDRFLQEVNLE